MSDGEKVGEATWLCLACGRPVMVTDIRNLDGFRSLVSVWKNGNGMQCRACAGGAFPFWKIEDLPEEYAAVENSDIEIYTKGAYEFPSEFVDSNE